VIEVHGPDERRGHISIRDGADCLATACDMGPYLLLWTYRGINLTPAVARDLGRALEAWADRHHSPDERDGEQALIEAVTGAAA
jgi:hypothetical protein